MEVDLNKIEEARQFGLRPEAVGCFIFERKLLLVYKKEHDLWQLPQGGIESGETIIAALKREMTEELGVAFSSLLSAVEVFAEDQIFFQAEKIKGRTIKTEDGRELPMTGKKYFFVKIEIGDPALDISQTEFNDSRWGGYRDSLSLAQGIRQPGKKRITIKAIEDLKNLGFL